MARSWRASHHGNDEESWMGQGAKGFLESAAGDVKKRWHDARTQAVAAAEDDYQRGVQAYGEAIRRGQTVVARTPQEVRALGATVKAAARNAAGAANAGVRSAGSAIMLGGADNAEAATEALFGLGGPGDFGPRYRNQLAAQHAADRQGAREHQVATRGGEVLGTLGGIFAADAPAAAGAAARMVPGGIDVMNAIQRAKRIGFIPEGLGTMSAVGGGAAGGATQLASDAARGRQTTLQDFLGSVGGGVVAGVGAVRRGPVLGAAAGGASTALLQGEDADDAMRAATASAYGGRVLGTVGEQVSNALPGSLKGSLGEELSFAKSLARGERIPRWPEGSEQVSRNLPTADGYAGPQQKVGLSKSYTKADWLTDWGRAIEAKFGISADLKRAQRRAVPELGQVYLPDHWLPSDIGTFSGGWFGSVGGQSSPDGTPQ
jgi:hypothetical protein